MATNSGVSGLIRSLLRVPIDSDTSLSLETFGGEPDPLMDSTIAGASKASGTIGHTKLAAILEVVAHRVDCAVWERYHVASGLAS
jgi:hypothetical protein